MSAYLCDSPHISACADIIHTLRCMGRQRYNAWHGMPQSVEGIFTAFLNENLKSLQARYSDTEDWENDSLFMIYEPQRIDLSFIDRHMGGLMAGERQQLCDYIKALDCLAYQSSEHDEWKLSPVRVAIQEATEILSGALIADLKEYDQATWGWTPKPAQLVRVRR